VMYEQQVDRSAARGGYFTLRRPVPPPVVVVAACPTPEARSVADWLAPSVCTRPQIVVPRATSAL
jgi:hypothetical protein